MDENNFKLIVGCFIPVFAKLAKSSLNWFSVDKDITSTLLKLSGVGVVDVLDGIGKVTKFNEFNWGDVERPENEFAYKIFAIE